MTDKSKRKQELSELARQAPGIAQEIPGKCAVQFLPDGPVREFIVALAYELSDDHNTVVFYSKTTTGTQQPGDWTFRLDIPRDMAPGDYELPLDPVFKHFVLFAESLRPLVSGGYGVAGTLTLINNDIGEGKIKGFVTNIRAEVGDLPPAFAHRIEFRTGS